MLPTGVAAFDDNCIVWIEVDGDQCLDSMHCLVFPSQWII
jgi:hypothetical protein